MQTIQAASANKTPLFKDSTTSDTNKKQNIVLQGIKKYSLVTILFGFIPIFLRTFPLVSYIFYVPFLNIILFFLLFITYFKLTKKISEWFSPINSTYIVILVSTSLILNFIIANFICAISIFFQCWYHILDFYTLGGVIGISDIHLIIFTAFVTRKIVDFASKKEKLNIRDIVCSLLFLCLAIFTFIQLINFWKQEIIRGQEETKQKRKEEEVNYDTELKEKIKRKRIEVETTFPTYNQLQINKKDETLVPFTGQFVIPDTNLMILYPDNLILNRNNNFPDIQYFDDQLRQKNYQRSMLYFKYNNIKHQFTKDQEAIEFILNEIKPIFYGYANAHYELNKQIDNFNLTNGLRLYFIEYGEKANWMNGIYNKLSILIAFPDGKYLIWEGYTDYDGGMGILKQILSTLKQIN